MAVQGSIAKIENKKKEVENEIRVKEIELGYKKDLKRIINAFNSDYNKIVDFVINVVKGESGTITCFVDSLNGCSISSSHVYGKGELFNQEIDDIAIFKAFNSLKKEKKYRNIIDVSLDYDIIKKEFNDFVKEFGEKLEKLKTFLKYAHEGKKKQEFLELKIEKLKELKDRTEELNELKKDLSKTDKDIKFLMTNE